MGLDFSPGNARFSYGGFQAFRHMLAAHIGLNWDVMIGRGFDKPDTSSDEYKAAWAHACADGIGPLLDHSDCDGELTPDECRRVAPRLRQIIVNWPADSWQRQGGERLAESMELAIRGDEPLRFH